MSRKLLIKHYGLLVGSASIAQICTLIAVGTVTRHSSVTAVATLFASLAVMALLTDVLDFGTSLWSLREVASGRQSIASMLHFCLVRATACLFLTFILMGGLKLIGAPTAWVVALLLPVSTSASNFLLSLLRARDDYWAFVTCQVADKILCLGIVIILAVASKADLALGYAFAVSVTPFASATIAVFRLRTKGVKIWTWPISFRVMLKTYSASRHFGITSIASDLSTLETPVVALIGGPAAAANFGSAQRVSNPAGMPAGLIAIRLQPQLSRLEWPAARRRALREGSLLLPVFGVFLLVAIWAPAVMGLLYGAAYSRDGADTLRLVLVAIGFGSANQVIATLIQAQGFDRTVARVVRVSIPVGLLFTGLLAYWLGAVGAAAGLVIKELCTMAGLVSSARSIGKSKEERS